MISSSEGQGLDLESYYKYLGTDSGSFRESMKDEALRKVKTRMIITAVAEQEGFEASDEDVDKEIENMAKQYSLEADKVREIAWKPEYKYDIGRY